MDAARLPPTAATARLTRPHRQVCIYTNRTTTDPRGRFGATANQAIARSMMSKQLRETFEESRRKLGQQAAKH